MLATVLVIDDKDLLAKVLVIDDKDLLATVLVIEDYDLLVTVLEDWLGYFRMLEGALGSIRVLAISLNARDCFKCLRIALRCLRLKWTRALANEQVLKHLK